MSDINIELSIGIVDGLEDLIDMNFGDYFGSLHETIRKTDNDQEAESLSRTMRRMMTTLFGGLFCALNNVRGPTCAVPWRFGRP